MACPVRDKKRQQGLGLNPLPTPDCKAVTRTRIKKIYKARSRNTANTLRYLLISVTFPVLLGKEYTRAVLIGNLTFI